MKKRILIVDDEVNVLNGLKRMLRAMSEEWEAEFVDNGYDAISMMEKDNFEILLTDMQMPLMSGVELLEKTQKNHPNTIRIILSGYTQFETAMKAMGLAHQFLTKPCDSEKLTETLSRAFLLRKILAQESLTELIKEMKSLPSMPDMYLKLHEILRNPEVNLDQISVLIAADAGMTAKLLQLVNSSFFGVANRIRDLSHAVRMLGIDCIKTLVLSIHIFSMFENGSIKDFPVDNMRDHNLNVAVIAKKIAEIEIPEKKAREDAFIGGLLHDCGKMILIEKLPGKYRKVVDLIKEQQMPVCDAEREVYGATHCDIGAYLLGLWGMWDSILETVIYHHSPNESPSKSFNTLTCVHIADYLDCQMRAYSGSLNQTELDTNYLENLGVADRLGAWRDIYQETVLKGPNL